MKDVSDKPTSRQDALSLPNEQVMSLLSGGPLADTLRAMGIDPAAVKVPEVAHHEKIAWEDLCVLNTKDRDTQVSDIVIVTMLGPNIDAPQEYPDYRGMVRVEFVTQLGEKLYVSHAMTYAATGELTPLWGWLSNQSVPFAMRFGRIETRKRNQYVIRAMPLDIETV